MPASIGRVEGSLKEMLPLGRRILVQPHETPDYKGTIILPESVKTTIPTTGIILAIGFDLQDDEHNRLQEGDQIVFGRYGGVELKFDDGHRRLIIHEDDVLAIIKGNIIIKEEI